MKPERVRTASRTPKAPGSRAAGPVSHAIRVLCVEDHAVLVEGLRAQFAIEGGIEIVGRLSTAARLVEEVIRLSPDAVLLDIELPGPDAFEMAHRLKEARPEVKVIVLSAYIRDAFITAAFAAGARAYFSKAEEPADIVAAIREVFRNRNEEFHLSPKVRDRCRPAPAAGRGASRAGAGGAVSGHAAGGEPVTLRASLTGREAEILRLIGKGLSRVQIAGQLCRSAKTVDGHQDRMMKKLGIATRADLMRFAIREGFAQA